MLTIFYPYEYANSVFAIDFEKLYSFGFRGIIFDIDNTLVFQDEDATEEVEELFSFLKSVGFKTVILSNNGEERVRRFLKNIDSPFVCKAYKPFKRGYRKALKAMNTEKEQTVFIGDQLFTDIFGANRCKIKSILVRPIKKDGAKPLFRRTLEKPFIRSYLNSGKYRHRLGNILK